VVIAFLAIYTWSTLNNDLNSLKGLGTNISPKLL
jgi:hypothetical protein